jgi:hypothetical protein
VESVPEGCYVQYNTEYSRYDFVMEMKVVIPVMASVRNRMYLNNSITTLLCFVYVHMYVYTGGINAEVW